MTFCQNNAILIAVDNPLKFGNITMTWERGRKLSTMSLANGSTASYKYNADGVRTQKTVGGVTTDYFLEGSTIVAQKTGNDVIWYYFGGDGTRDAIEYNGTVYYYMYNPQGDVIGLFDGNTNVVVEYTYDSWGKIIDVDDTSGVGLANANPFRYRGYYYDEESGMYYLNSRYYHPEIGRFINADGLVQTGQGILGTNMYAYCANNPIIFCDPSGCSYTITMPAVGDGPVTVTTSIGISYSYDAPKVGNSYYFDAKDFEKAVYDNATEKVKPIIQATVESWCDDIAKGFMEAVGKKNLTYIIPYGHEITAFTNIKGYGLASLASTAYQLCWDIEQYGNNPLDCLIAGTITVVSTGATIALSAVVITYCTPVVAAAGTIFVGVAMSTISDDVKKSILG